MFLSSLADVHEWLADNGFKRDTTETTRYLYEGFLDCNHIKVPINMSFSDLTFQNLPEIHLLEPRPEQLDRPLPHIDHKNKLCYLDEYMYRVDPYDPLQSIVNLLGRAKQVIIDNIAEKNINDVGYEFGSYWEGSSVGFILSRHQSGDIIEFNYLRYITPIGNEQVRQVVGNHSEILEFQERYNATLINKDNHAAIWIDVTKAALLPKKGPWPPRHFKEFYEWLMSVDNTAAKTLKNKLGTKRALQKKLMILLNTSGDIVGVEINVPKKFIQSPGRFAKQLLIDKGCSAVNFDRVLFSDYSQKYLITRNLTGLDLSSKKIVLIGCGNIGGYLSRLLVQAGAGRGKKRFVMYDGQILSTGNIGRHYLDERYLYENKAIACEHKLMEEFRSIYIKAIPREFVDISEIETADIVIDSTGREPFSLVLNNQVIQRYKAKKYCPDILYVWNDGNGYCGRALYYDGTGGCYRCLQDLSGRDRFPPLKSDDDLVPIKYQCGDSFVPYPPSVSVQTAGMGLEIMLEWVNGGVTHHFHNKKYHEKAREHKDKTLAPTTGCPACQN